MLYHECISVYCQHESHDWLLGCRSQSVMEEVKDFDAEGYLKQRYSTTDNLYRTFALPHLHEFYKSLGSTSLKILELGAGPVISYAICAAPYASEIVLAEYAKENRKALQQWIDKDPKAHDWMPFFKHIVVNIEGGEEKDVTVREEKLRSTIKVAHCDFTENPMLPEAFMGRRYDIVLSAYSLEDSPTRDSHVEALKSIATSLLKPQGKLLLIHAERRVDISGFASYKVGEKWIKFLRMSKAMMMEDLAAANFTIIKRVDMDFDTTLPQHMNLPEDPTEASLYFAGLN